VHLDTKVQRRRVQSIENSIQHKTPRY